MTGPRLNDDNSMRIEHEVRSGNWNAHLAIALPTADRKQDRTARLRHRNSLRFPGLVDEQQGPSLRSVETLRDDVVTFNLGFDKLITLSNPITQQLHDMVDGI